MLYFQSDGSLPGVNIIKRFQVITVVLQPSLSGFVQIQVCCIYCWDRPLLWSLCSVSGISDSKLNTNVLTEFVTSAMARFTCKTLPGLLRTFCTACDKSCVWRPGNEANIAPHVTENLQPYYMYIVSRENLRAFPLLWRHPHRSVQEHNGQQVRHNHTHVQYRHLDLYT